MNRQVLGNLDQHHRHAPSRPADPTGTGGRGCALTTPRTSIAAASRRHELTRSQGHPGAPRTRRRGRRRHLRVRGPGSRGLPVLALHPARHPRRGPAAARPRPPGTRDAGARHATAAATPPCCAGWRPPPPATGNWPRTISGCATSSPKPSASSAPPASAPIPGQRPRRSRESCPSHNNWLLLTMIISRHADSSKTLSPTSPPRSGHRMEKRLKITAVTPTLACSGAGMTRRTPPSWVPRNSVSLDRSYLAVVCHLRR